MSRRHRWPSPERSSRPAHDTDFDIPYDPTRVDLEPLPKRDRTNAVELLERLRAELRIVAPVLYARLLTPKDQSPTLHTVRGGKDDRVEIGSDCDYRWRSNGEPIGSPEHARDAAVTIARAMDAPVRALS